MSQINSWSGLWTPSGPRWGLTISRRYRRTQSIPIVAGNWGWDAH